MILKAQSKKTSFFVVFPFFSCLDLSQFQHSSLSLCVLRHLK
jgi:hypothetical protein